MTYCEFCWAPIYNNSHFTQHAKTHQQYECSQCGLKFDKTGLEEHIGNHECTKFDLNSSNLTIKF
jgi:hypothetical protein